MVGQASTEIRETIAKRKKPNGDTAINTDQGNHRHINQPNGGPNINRDQGNHRQMIKPNGGSISNTNHFQMNVSKYL
jgi:hypothetical protein